MAILGNGGILELSRETPQPMAMSIARFNANATPISISGKSRVLDWRSCVIASSDGLPFDVNSDGYADSPDGHGIYRGSTWLTGPSRAFYTGSDTDASPFYHQFTDTFTLITQSGAKLDTQSNNKLIGLSQVEDSDNWYNNTASTGLATTYDAYIHRDELDRITFFPTEALLTPEMRLIASK